MRAHPKGSRGLANWVLGFRVVVLWVRPLGGYMISRYLDPWGLAAFIVFTVYVGFL